jgi:hypothetical protein
VEKSVPSYVTWEKVRIMLRARLAAIIWVGIKEFICDSIKCYENLKNGLWQIA